METGPSAGGHLPSHRGGRKYVEARLSDQHHAREGGEARGRLMEAGAHLWLAEELRACASLLTSDGAGDPRVASSRLEELAQALQAEGATQRWDAGGSYGGSVEQSSRAASCLRRANQLRHASRAVGEYALALRHGGARGWVTVFGDGGMGACDPTIVPTLLSLADSETALARAKARVQSRPGAHDHAHAALRSPHGHSQPQFSPPQQLSIGSDMMPPSPGSNLASKPVASRAAAHVRRRLAEANDELHRGASLVADAAPLLPPPPPDYSRVAARVLAGGGHQASKSHSWRNASGMGEDGGLGKGYVAAERWGSTIHPQHGGTWLGAGWRWRGGANGDGSDGSDADDDALDEARLEVRARAARRAMHKASRLAGEWEADVCVKCVERHVHQAPTLLAR